MNAIDSHLDFDWRSCEWTYCGALADAQEALDALDHLLGANEPFECLFCMVGMERSLRDSFSLQRSDLRSQGTV
jgi:hypothetical protein